METIIIFTDAEMMDIHTALLERYETLHDLMTEAKKERRFALFHQRRLECERVNAIINKIEE